MTTDRNKIIKRLTETIDTINSAGKTSYSPKTSSAISVFYRACLVFARTLSTIDQDLEQGEVLKIREKIGECKILYQSSEVHNSPRYLRNSNHPHSLIITNALEDIKESMEILSKYDIY